MDKNESEQIIRETIEYANREIRKSRRRSHCLAGGVILGMLILLLACYMLFHYELPVAYQEGLVNVTIPEDQGLDIQIELPNYQKTNAVLVKTSHSSYDLYIGIMQTPATKILKDADDSNNFLRVGNGIIFDHQGEQLLGFVPNGSSGTSIQHIYYLDDLSEAVMTKSDQELVDSQEKTLIWEQNA